jgi:molybdenum cofactor synthesis domain-containing protein
MPDGDGVPHHDDAYDDAYDDAPAGPPLRASIVLIGDELLDGWVADANAHWLAARLAQAGIPLDRIHTVPDDHEAIDEALTAELGRSRPRVVVTSGGIGSTPDDLTMAAVARHLGQRLLAHPEISARIDRLVDRAAAAGSPIDPEQATAIRRMAMVPADSRILAGSTGMIPGVVLDVDGGSQDPHGATITVLPGVPGQFREIVECAVEPELLAGRGRPRRVTEFTHGHPESAFTGVLERLIREHPDLIIGSYPGVECVIRVKGADDDVDAALRALRAHAARLEENPSAVRRREAWRRRHSG